MRGSGIKVVEEVAANFVHRQAVGAMEDILRTNPKVSAVFCANDQLTLGALQTLAVRAVKHERVRRNVNTANPLVTQQNAKAYLRKVEENLGG